jgi:uncharacterized lipoprotein YmbA
LLAGAGLVSCASAPTPVLIALPPADATGTPQTAFAAAAPPAVLLVRRLALPEYMAARRVRYSEGAATLAEWPDTYWAERIEIGMAREFVSGLRRRLPGWTVCDASCGDTPPDLTLKVDLSRLDVVRREQRLSASAQAQLSAPGPVSSQSTAIAAWAGSYVVPMPDDTAQGQARAMSDLLGALADESAAAVARARTAPGGVAAKP